MVGSGRAPHPQARPQAAVTSARRAAEGHGSVGLTVVPRPGPASQRALRVATRSLAATGLVRSTGALPAPTPWRAIVAEPAEPEQVRPECLGFDRARRAASPWPGEKKA